MSEPKKPRLTAFYEQYFKKRPQQSRSRSVVEAILVAALEGISRTGEDVALSDVAARAGVGIGSLYDYFRDRRSLFAGAVAKVTEDNLEAFEALLMKTEPLPLREAVAAVVDFALATYASDSRVPRSVVRLAYALDLMPMLAESQGLFASSLARSLARRADVRVPDIEAAAYVATQSVMGLVHTLMWEREPRLSRAAVRDVTVDMIAGYLAGEARGSAATGDVAPPT